MPLTSKTFSQLIDFTRTSAATYVDQLGRIVPTPVSPNLITFTQEFDNAAWTKTNSGTGLVPSVTINAAVAPDGTTTADLVTFNRGAGNTLSDISRLLQTLTVTAGLHTQSIWLKAATPSDVGKQLALRNVEGTGYGVISLTADWVRYSRTELGSVGNWQLENRGTVTADTSVSVLVWGAQLEQTPDANLTLGSELVTNGDFSGGSTGWTANPGWAISGGQAAASATSASLVNGFTSVSGQAYRVAFDVVSYTSGTLAITVGANYTTNVTLTGLAPGRYVVYMTSGATTTRGVEFYGGAVTATIDNISVRAITAASPSTYTRNFGGRFPPRFDYDPVTLSPRGLLIEEQRTNLLVRSEELDHTFWSKSRTTVTANAATSPDGTVDADKLIEDTAAGTHRVFQQATKAASVVTRTFSVYLKAAERTLARITVSNNNEGVTTSTDINLSAGTATAASTPQDGTISGQSASIINAGNGWYRCIITATLDASITTPGAFIFLRDGSGNFSYTGNGTSGIFVWGAQWEDGAFATSYIPTVASQVTRTADSAAITGANFSTWYNQSEGTFVVDYDVVSTAVTAKSALTTNDGTSNNINIVYVGSSGLAVCETRSGGASQGQLFPSSVSANSPVKSAFAYKANDFAAAGAGGTAVTDNTGTVAGGQTELNIGYSRNYGGLQLCGHIRSIRYYPTRLTNAQLQALTA